MSKRFVVGHFDLFNNELKLQVIYAATWQEAVIQHEKYPFCVGKEGQPSDEATPVADVIHKDNGDEYYPELEEDEAFKQCCFDCDCMMNWIEILPE